MIVVPESEIIKPPKAGAEEAIEMWTEVALGKYCLTVSL